MTGAIGSREPASLPTRRPSALTREQPNLKQPQRSFAAVVLGMADTRPGAHDLHVSRDRGADVARVVFVRYNTLPHIGDDFHVDVRVATETRARGNFIVVPNHERAERTVGTVAIGGNGKMVVCVEPSMMAAVERCFGSELKH